jgi:hypothetical protein
MICGQREEPQAWILASGFYFWVPGELKDSNLPVKMDTAL